MMVDQQQLIQKILLEYFLKSQARNPRYSIRAFSRKLGISSAALSELLRGKRRVSAAKAFDFAEKLKLDKKTIELLKRAFSNDGRLESLKAVSNPLKELIIGTEEFDVMADWVCFALVALMRTEGFQSDIRWMSKRLGVQMNRVKKALDLLEKVGTISVTKSGEFKDNPVCYRTSDDFPDSLNQRRQVDGLRNAISRIQERDALQIGNFSTISADISKLPEAEKLIEDFLKRLSLFLAAGKKTEVMELNIQLFPLSRASS